MNELKEERSKEDSQKLIDKINEDVDLARIEEMIKDNKIEFIHKDKKYRVRLMNLKEKEELHLLRLKKFGQLMQDKDILIEATLIEKYKEKGIDIDKLNDDLKKVEAEIHALTIMLGEAISKSESETILNGYKEKIDTLYNAKQIFIVQKTNLLQMSLENQLENYVASFITFLTLDININDSWKRLFIIYDDFINCEDEDLINKAGSRSMLLQYR